MKKYLIPILISLILGLSGFSAYAAEQILEMDNLDFIIDYDFKDFSNKPININGRILLPMREFFETIGAEIQWSEEEQRVTGAFKGNEVTLQIENPRAAVNNSETILDTPPVLVEGKTYIPLRFAAESLGYTIIWNEEFRTIYAFSEYEEPDLTELEKSSQANGCLPQGTSVIDTFTGIASWYGGIFHGRYTANDEIFDQYALTGAHRTLPFGTFVRVTHTLNNKSVIIRINDRGPHIQGRIIDLSMAAADLIGLKSRGLGEVVVEVLENYY